LRVTGLQANRYVLIVAALAAILLFCIELNQLTDSVSRAQTGGSNISSPPNTTSCQCVVFRMDDIQDSFVNNAQLEAMNLFLSRGQPLSLGIIMKDIGEDIRVTGKVGEGSQRGLFELGLHGWDHVDYTNLTETEQRSTLNEANEKLNNIFGNESDIFIPPFGYYNNETVRAMEQLGIRILSASISYEEDFEDNESVFNKTRSNLDEMNTNESNSTKLQNAVSPENQEVYFLPGMVQFKDYVNGSIVKVPLDRILSQVSKNMGEFGYAVIVFHPQDLVQVNMNGEILDSGALNSTEVQDLSQLIDTLLADGIKISTMSEIVGIEPRNYSYFGRGNG
jgi:peptidoglycan/xylan/chitin deacetylase (PgdA/CDA1 family)